MKLFTCIVAACLAFIASAKQSDPFFLVLHSDDSTLNGKALTACHEGAAIEGLCVDVPLAKAKAKYDTFTFNYTKSTPNSGSLNFELIGGSFKGTSQHRYKP